MAVRVSGGLRMVSRNEPEGGVWGLEKGMMVSLGISGALLILRCGVV